MSSKPYFSTYVQDLEQTPFDSVGFVERLTWRINDGKEDNFDAEYLKRKFEEEIGSLQASIENFQVKVQRLEDQQSLAKHRYLDSLQRLHDRNSDALDRLKVGILHVDFGYICMFSIWTRLCKVSLQRLSIWAISWRACMHQEQEPTTPFN